MLLANDIWATDHWCCEEVTLSLLAHIKIRTTRVPNSSGCSFLSPFLQKYVYFSFSLLQSRSECRDVWVVAVTGVKTWWACPGERVIASKRVRIKRARLRPTSERERGLVSSTRALNSAFPSTHPSIRPPHPSPHSSSSCMLNAIAITASSFFFPLRLSPPPPTPPASKHHSAASSEITIAQGLGNFDQMRALHVRIGEGKGCGGLGGAFRTPGHRGGMRGNWNEITNSMAEAPHDSSGGRT